MDSEQGDGFNSRLRSDGEDLPFDPHGCTYVTHLKDVRQVVRHLQTPIDFLPETRRVGHARRDVDQLCHTC